jgi:cation/acetate symporter
MKKFLVIMVVALTLGVAINAVLPDLSFAGPESQIASAVTAQAPERVHRVEANKTITISLFLVIISITLCIVVWAAKRTKTTADFYAARGR